MHVFLVHHAIAVGADVDTQRPLSSVGQEQAASLAAMASDKHVVPAAIWHSGKLRARQTAEAFWRTCNPFAEFRMVRGLRPEDPPDWMRDALEGEERDVLLAGHMPHMAALATVLAGSVNFPINGMIALERVGPRRYEERWRLTPPVRS
jgi:phosphohistidine phosphatase